LCVLILRLFCVIKDLLTYLLRTYTLCSEKKSPTHVFFLYLRGDIKGNMSGCFFLNTVYSCSCVASVRTLALTAFTFREKLSAECQKIYDYAVEKYEERKVEVQQMRDCVNQAIMYSREHGTAAINNLLAYKAEVTTAPTIYWSYT